MARIGLSGINSNVLEGRRGSNYVPSVPLWVAVIRTFQAAVAITILVLMILSQSVLNPEFSGYSLTFFTVGFTLHVFIYLVYSTVIYPRKYHGASHIFMESLLTIFWIATSATLAINANIFYGTTTVQIIRGQRYFSATLPSDIKTAMDFTIASAGLGGLEWALFTTTLGYYGFIFYRSRNANSTASMPATIAMTDQVTTTPAVNSQSNV